MAAATVDGSRLIVARQARTRPAPFRSAGGGGRPTGHADVAINFASDAGKIATFVEQRAAGALDPGAHGVLARQPGYGAAVTVGPDDAIAAVSAVAGPAPDGSRYVANREDESVVWVVAIRYTAQRATPGVWPGGTWLVAPDLSVFPLNSNTVVRDCSLARALLDRLHAEGLTRHVDPHAFIARVETMAREHEKLSAAVIAEARAGQLRQARQRSLP